MKEEVMGRGCKTPVGLHHILCKIVQSEIGNTSKGSPSGFVQCSGTSREDGQEGRRANCLLSSENSGKHIKTGCPYISRRFALRDMHVFSPLSEIMGV